MIAPGNRTSRLSALGLTSAFCLAAIFIPRVCFAAPQQKQVLTCSFEQIMFFGDQPSDFPNGPAYFGSSQPLVAAKPDNYNFTDVEANLINNANKMVKDYRGAKFTVDLRDGTLKSIPFGDKSFLIITPIDNAPDKPVILTRDHDKVARGYAFIGYYDTKASNYEAFLMIQPPMIDFARPFEYMSTGETLLGYCD